jgi:hypothetical protein
VLLDRHIISRMSSTSGEHPMVLELFSRNARAIIAVVAGFLLLTLSHSLIAPLGLIAGTAGVGMIVASTSAELFSYLQRGLGFSVLSVPPISSRGASPNEDMIARITSVEKRIVDLQNNQNPETQVSTGLLSDSEKDDIKERIFNHVIQADVKEYLFAISKKFVEEHMHTSAELLRHRYTGIVSALEQEILNLGRRANVNLVMGVAITLIGLIILGYFVLYAAHPIFSDRFEALIYFGTRLTLVVFIEVFAYFFLRLYRYSLFEIKYFQNESTNARFRIIALEACIQNGSKTVVERICMELAKTERNFILKKGETTLSLRQDEIELINDNNVSKLIERIMNSPRHAAPARPSADTDAAA